MRDEPLSELVAFTAPHVCRLTGLSVRQLSYWDKTDFFSPQYVGEQPHRAFGRIYSFRDVVGLRTIAILRPRVPLQELRKVGEWLYTRHEAPWSSLRFYVGGRTVFFDDPATGARMTARPMGAPVMRVAMEPIAAKMRKAAEALRRRTNDDYGRIEQNRYIVHNSPVLSGSRVPTSAVWNLHEAKYTTPQIIAEYPRLTRKDVAAAIAYERQQRRERTG